MTKNDKSEIPLSFFVFIHLSNLYLRGDMSSIDI